MHPSGHLQCCMWCHACAVSRSLRWLVVCKAAVCVHVHFGFWGIQSPPFSMSACQLCCAAQALHCSGTVSCLGCVRLQHCTLVLGGSGPVVVSLSISTVTVLLHSVVVVWGLSACAHLGATLPAIPWRCSAGFCQSPTLQPAAALQNCGQTVAMWMRAGFLTNLLVCCVRQGLCNGG
jgi:hypothetical protein